MSNDLSLPQWLIDMAAEADARLSARSRSDQPAWFQEFDDERNGRVPPCKACGQDLPKD